MRNYNALIVGAISLSNKGTAAIIISTIDSLQAVIPDLKLNIELFYPEQQRTLINLETENVRIVAPLLQSPITAVATFVLSLLWYPLVRLRIARPLPLPVFKHYLEADIIIDLSAEAFITYFDDDFWQQMIRFGAHLYPILLSLLLNKPYAFYAQTMAPFGVFRPLMMWVLDRASIVTVRDPVSLENLKRDGIDTSRIHLTADPAFLLESHRPLWSPEKRGKGPIIGLSVARQTGRTLGEQQFENLLQELSETTRQLIQELDATVIFIPHSSGKFRRVSNDISVGLKMREKINDPERFMVIQEEWSPQQIKGFIGQCDALLSLRMHPVIFALSTGVPCVIIAFNDKAFGLMQRFSLEQYVHRVDQLNSECLAMSTIDCLTHREEIEIRLKSTMDTMRDLAMENARLVRNWLVAR
jgi:colanic acid/amylovoran biosynthesis protein